jgi:hypothetical protein
MGWASASEIFDPVAHALIECNAPDETKRRVLGMLIDKLRDNDWDTEDESLQEFRSDPLIVSLFYERGVGNELSYELDGVLDYDAKRNEWVLRCNGRDGCGDLERADGSSTTGHDRLVRLWASHDAETHGGDGQVPQWMLCNPGA